MKIREIILALILLTICVWGNSLFNDFIWDDFALIVNNPFIRNFKFMPNFFCQTLNQTQITTRGLGAYYRPFFLLSFTIDYSLWKLDPFFYHFINLGLYILNIILIFVLMLKLTHDKLLASLTSLFFCLHPVHVETVAAIFDRMDLLASFFILFSLICFILLHKENRFKGLFYFLALISFIFGLLSKETAAVLPLIFIIYDLFFNSGFKGVLKHKYFYVACLLIEAVYFLFRFLVLGPNFLSLSGKTQFINFLPPEFTFWKLPIILQTFLQYLKILVLPNNLTAFYLVKIKPFLNTEIIAALLCILALFFLIIKLKSRAKEISFFICWFFIFLLPTINIVHIGNRIAERHVYLASLSFCFMLAYFFTKILTKITSSDQMQLKRKLAILAIFLISCFYGYTTILRNYDWRNEFTLWSKEVQINPRNPSAHLNLGNAYISLGDSEKAIEHYNYSITLDALNPKALNSLGAALVKMGSEEEGLRKMHQAAKIDQGNPVIYNNLGRTYNIIGDFNKAIKAQQKTLALNPKFLPAHYDLGIAYFNIKDYTKALSHFAEILRIDKDNAQAYYGIALARNAQDRVPEAINELSKALEIDPDFKKARSLYLGLRTKLHKDQNRN